MKPDTKRPMQVWLRPSVRKLLEEITVDGSFGWSRAQVIEAAIVMLHEVLAAGGDVVTLHLADAVEPRGAKKSLSSKKVLAGFDSDEQF